MKCKNVNKKNQQQQQQTKIDDVETGQHGEWTNHSQKRTTNKKRKNELTKSRNNTLTYK